MLKVLPYVAKETCFALKGGTAINFFHRNMPRLSIDIDLTYLPIDEWASSLLKMSEALQRISATLRKAGFKVQEGRAANRVSKLFVSDGESRITVEPNDVIRGAVHPPENRETAPLVEEMFETSATIQTLTLAEVYAGKLCAALDRQHPRDLFDMKLLFDHEGITEAIRRTFVVYLSCHDRPLNELIEPTRKDLREIFDREFVGMTTAQIALEELLAVRERYIAEVKNGLTQPERQFLVSLKEGQPKWELLDLPGIENLPAVQWKLLNIRKMDKQKQVEYVKRLRDKLGV